MRTVKYFVSWFLTFIFIGSLIYFSVVLYKYKFLPIYFVLALLIYLLNVITGVQVFNSNREDYAKLSWLVIILLIPLFGSTLFLIFGQRFSRRMNKETYQKRYERTFLAQKTGVLKRPQKAGGEPWRLLQTQSRVSNRPVLPANIRLFTNGGRAFEAMFDSMRKAKKFIHVHYYIFKKGEIFTEFQSILMRKAKAGVRVRLIIDDFGRWALPHHELKTLRLVGCEVFVWGKVHFPFVSSENGYRTHRKLVVIDGKMAYTGGLNIADEYALMSPTYGFWADLQLCITGPLARSFAILFLNDWEFMANKKISVTQYAPSLPKPQNTKDLSYGVMVETGPDNTFPTASDGISKLISCARKTILLVTPYFIPDDPMVTALRTAATSGVDIKIILPGKPDKPSVLMVSHFFARTLAHYGVKFYSSLAVFQHSKMGLFDGKIAYAGTINLDVRSFYSQFEMFTIFIGSGAKDVGVIFNDYLAHAKLITWTKETKIMRWSRVKRFFARVFAPLL